MLCATFWSRSDLDFAFRSIGCDAELVVSSDATCHRESCQHRSKSPRKRKVIDEYFSEAEMLHGSAIHPESAVEVVMLAGDSGVSCGDLSLHTARHAARLSCRPVALSYSSGIFQLVAMFPAVVSFWSAIVNFAPRRILGRVPRRCLLSPFRRISPCRGFAPGTMSRSSWKEKSFGVPQGQLSNFDRKLVWSYIIKAKTVISKSTLLSEGPSPQSPGSS